MVFAARILQSLRPFSGRMGSRHHQIVVAAFVFHQYPFADGNTVAARVISISPSSVSETAAHAA